MNPEYLSYENEMSTRYYVYFPLNVTLSLYASECECCATRKGQGRVGQGAAYIPRHVDFPSSESIDTKVHCIRSSRISLGTGCPEQMSLNGGGIYRVPRIEFRRESLYMHVEK